MEVDKGEEMLGEQEMDGEKEGGKEEEEEEERVVGGRWRGLLAGLRNVNLHFSHLFPAV